MSVFNDVTVSAVSCVAPVAALLGEGPLWDPREKRLYWLDIKGEFIFRFNPETEQSEKFPVPGMVSALGLAQSGGFVCAMRDGFAQLSFAAGGPVIQKISDPEANKPDNRFNDGKVDPAGGFWAGSMDDAEADVSGTWWRLGSDGGVDCIDKDYKVTNGPAFDPERDRAYLTDSAAQRVYAACFVSAGISERRVFLQFKEGDGYPDGMDVDVDGCLWIAFWDAGVIRRFSPDGELLMEIAIPASRPTSLAIVEDRIFVTSASIGLSAADRKSFPDAGGLFEVKLSRRLGRDEVWYFDDRGLV